MTDTNIISMYELNIRYHEAEIRRKKNKIKGLNRAYSYLIKTQSDWVKGEFDDMYYWFVFSDAINQVKLEIKTSQNKLQEYKRVIDRCKEVKDGRDDLLKAT